MIVLAQPEGAVAPARPVRQAGIGQLGGVVLSWGIVVVAVLSVAGGLQGQEMRFPAPEFQGGYEFPETAAPPPPGEVRAWVDVGVLGLAMSLAGWLAIRRRSRRGLFWLSVLCLGYFGFYKQGCVCPIGSIQNVALSLFDDRYAVPASVLWIFLLPLVFALFMGRLFCSSVCALGAIQDLVAFRPISLPKPLELALRMIPYAYLGLGVLFAATNTGFLICRFDPFVGFFRMNGNAPYLYLGAGFLLVGVFVGRPYCRFVCPYGVLLGWMSRFSKWHLSITPTVCVDCRLCEQSCPFDAIDMPNTGLDREPRATGVRRLGFLFVMLPVLILLGAWIGHRLSAPMSRANRWVSLAEQVVREDRGLAPVSTPASEAFRASGLPREELMDRAALVQRRMGVGGMLLGGLLALVFGTKLIGVSLFRNRRDYQVNRSDCFSCGRCCLSCPIDPRHPLSGEYRDLGGPAERAVGLPGAGTAAPAVVPAGKGGS